MSFPGDESNACATDGACRARKGHSDLLLLSLAVALLLHPDAARAQQQSEARDVHPAATATITLAGAATALVAHEAGHLLFGVIFDADPGFQRVEFKGIPFFALTHRPDLSPRREFAISSAGFWVQHATNEWLLTKRPRLRQERAPFAKGMFGFNLVISATYSVAAFARTGPAERDTRGMAVTTGIDERWIGAVVLAPAVFDVWRYYDPDARLPVWLSRAAKIGGVLLILKAGG